MTFLALLHGSSSFTINPDNHVRASTKLFLKDRIAEMIDLELLRLQNKAEDQKQWMEKNKQVLEQTLPEAFSFNADEGELVGIGLGVNLEEEENTIQHRKDIRLVQRNPQKYCADRCVSTGHCDILEDMFEMDPREVIKFCTDCVLSDEEEPCDIPETLLSGDFPDLSLRP
eukprot:CAMPEP_0197246624 /NCGR_PEP_ID=MMETSP1429-20130617/18391_1 /TAXON_ID=49237 /ORGANISM="Chaetoceros  sp., Strain UNC1202" /LENGTH=170 /DNA_ID=CAMNT_0042707329 /DNA_START=70 /DNA_END=582 /DNA_ORIENTATION=+